MAETVRAGTRVAWVDAADVRGRDDFRQTVAVGVGARLGPQDEPLAAIAAAAGGNGRSWCWTTASTCSTPRRKQNNALRNLLVLLARVGADEAAAVVDAALPPVAVYPTEAARLDRARAAVAERLGPGRAAALHRRGAGLTPAQLSEEALTAIDAALERLTGRRSHSGPRVQRR